MSNASENVQSIVDVDNTSEPFAPPLRPPLSMPLASITVGLVVGFTGMCANGVVLAVLIFARRQLGSHVNTLITNQSAMDLFACIFLTIGSSLSLPGTPENYPELGEIGNYLVCVLLRHRVLAMTSMIAVKMGLVVISIERYVKIVHAIIHRKYYRKWMTAVGVAVPWIIGFCTFAIPAFVSTRADVPGQCPILGVWPSKAVQTVSSYL